MPLAILLIGAILIAVGVNNKVFELGELIKEDFAPSDGSPGFHIWIFALVFAGALAYVKPLKGIGNGFIVLILLGMLLSNQGFIAKLQEAFNGEI